MVGFFDYLFYLIYKFYSPKEKGAATTSAMIIGGLQAINVLSIIMLPAIFTSAKGYLNTITFIIVLFFFQIINYIRYIYREKVTIQGLGEKWQKRSEAQKIRIRTLSFLYVALSIGIFFGLAIYLGSNS
jgi:hypothetical protein